MTREQVSRWARRYVLVSAGFLVGWQAALVAGVGRRASVTLGLFGFVLHMVFGKAYSLVPAYFDRELAFPRAPAVSLPVGTVISVTVTSEQTTSHPSGTAPSLACAARSYVSPMATRCAS